MDAALTSSSLQPWHAASNGLPRLIADLIVGELKHLRPGGGPRLPALPWPPALDLVESLGLDSLERMSIASALNEALHLHESGIEDLLLARHRFGEWVEIAQDSLKDFDSRLTFRTSGSSGDAKPCVHALATLNQEVSHLASLTSATRRVLSAVPAHHIYGFLFTVLLPRQLACGDALDVRHLTPNALVKLLRPGDLIVSHPAHWELLARHVARMPGGVHGVSSTAPCPDEVAGRLEAIGLQSLLQVYGSSETAGIATRKSAAAPFTLMPFWSRDAQEGSRLLRSAPDQSCSSIAPQDDLAWEDDRQFRVLGRLDDAVQVGGVNVFPARVQRALLKHPQIKDAAVRLMTAAEGGRLKAFIVAGPQADECLLLDDLWAWTELNLTAPERPKAFSFGTHVPRNALGKPMDWPVLLNAPLDEPDVVRG